MKPQDYLVPENFLTDFDYHTNHIKSGYAQDQYNEGLTIGNDYQDGTLFINAYGRPIVQSGLNSVSFYMRFGQNACSAFLLMGFLDSGIPIQVYDEETNKWVKIK